MCFGLGFGFLLTMFVGPAQVRFAEPNLLGGSLQVLELPAGAGRAPCVRTRQVAKAREAFVTAPRMIGQGRASLSIRASLGTLTSTFP